MSDLNELVKALSGTSPDSTELLDKLRGLLGMPNAGRSPGWKPLKDMRAPTTQKGRLNRPHFEWSADDDGMTVIAPFPRLFWDQNGKEVKIESEEHLSRVGAGWTASPPMLTALSASERAAAELALLSPEDQAFVLEAQKQVRLGRVREMLAGLSSADIAAVTAAQKPAEPAAPLAAVEAKGKKSA